MKLRHICNAVKGDRINSNGVKDYSRIADVDISLQRQFWR